MEVTTEYFTREILGNHTIVGKISIGPFVDGYDLVCRCGNFWFLIDDQYSGTFCQLTEKEARELIANNVA